MTPIPELIDLHTHSTASDGTLSPAELVRAAIRYIGLHSDSGGLDVLFPLIGHPDWSVRAEAIQTVADRRLIRAVPSILRRLDVEDDDFVRDVTLSALKRLEGEVG